jgi:hypothetical protein
MFIGLLRDTYSVAFFEAKPVKLAKVRVMVAELAIAAVKVVAAR